MEAKGTQDAVTVAVIGEVRDAEVARAHGLLTGNYIALCEVEYRGRRAVLLATVKPDAEYPVQPVAMLLRPEDFADLDAPDAPAKPDLPTGVYL